MMTTAADLAQSETLISAEVIDLVVEQNMTLGIHPTLVAASGDHNSSLFKIHHQPAALDALACRAEVISPAGTKTYRLVVDGAFPLTADMADAAGTGRLQLVYGDGVNTISKTSVATFYVAPSVNAVDESAPEFKDGLAQLQLQAFAQVQSPNQGENVATFYNISGQPVGALIFPPGQGSGLDEAAADLLYLRLDGRSAMQGSVGISGPNRGVTWEDSGRQGALYSTGTQLVLRLPEGDPPFVIEPNSGSAASRSPVLTQASGDLRYLARSGGQMTGPFISQPGSSNSNLGVSVGDNASGFWKSGSFLLCVSGGQLVWQASVSEIMFGIRLNMATQAITNVADPTAAQDAANRRYVDAAVATVPRPNMRTYIPNGVTFSAAAQLFLDQAFPVADNTPRTIVITLFPSYAGGTPGAFYDLAFTCGLLAGVEARSAVYRTAGAYMQSPIRFAATVTPSNSQIQVQLYGREVSNNPTELSMVGVTAEARSYVTVEEMQN